MKKKSFDWSAFRRYLPYLTAYAKETWAAVVLGIAAGVSSVYMNDFLLASKMRLRRSCHDPVDQKDDRGRNQYDQRSSRRSADRCRSSAVQRPLSHFAFVCRSGFSDCGQSMVDPATRQPRGVFIRRRLT